MLKQLIKFSILWLILILLVAACQPSNNQQLSTHKKLLREMYQYFGTLKHNTLAPTDLEKFYNPKVTMIINGQKVAQGYQEFYQHFKMMLAKTKNFQFVFPKHSMTAEGNRVAVQYNIVIQAQQTKQQLHVIAVFTFNKGKISNWNEIVAKAPPRALGLIKKEK